MHMYRSFLPVLLWYTNSTFLAASRGWCEPSRGSCVASGLAWDRPLCSAKSLVLSRLAHPYLEVRGACKGRRQCDIAPHTLFQRPGIVQPRQLVKTRGHVAVSLGPPCACLAVRGRLHLASLHALWTRQEPGPDRDIPHEHPPRLVPCPTLTTVVRLSSSFLFLLAGRAQHAPLGGGRGGAPSRVLRRE